MLRLLSGLSAHIYDIFISYFLTIASHLILINNMHLTGGHFLDVGCGTGKPLKAIINHLKKYFEKIVGVDLDSAYTEKAIKQFENDGNV